MKRILPIMIFLTLAIFSISCAAPVSLINNLITGNSDLIISAGTGKTLVLETPVYDDLSIAMSQARIPAALAPTWTPYKGSQIPAYSATQVNVIYFSAQLPHTYKEGTNLEFHIHIAYPDALAGDSAWYFTYSWANIGDSFPAPTLTPQVLVASPLVADYHQMAEIVASMDGTGKKISSTLLCSIQRTGTYGDDDYPSAIYLVSADFHHQINTIGSRAASSK